MLSKQQKSARKRWEDPNERRRQSRVMKDRWENLESRKKLVESSKIGHNTPEAKRKFSIISKDRWENPNGRKKLLEAQKRGNSTSESKRNRSVACKSSWKDPEIRKRRIESFITINSGKMLKIRELVFYKKGNLCEICEKEVKGVRTPVLHHLNPSALRFYVLGTEAPKYNYSEIDYEIDKCILLCKSCHTKLHLKAYDYLVRIGAIKEYIDWGIDYFDLIVLKGYAEKGVERHHSNLDKTNNSEENLIYLSKTDHRKLHSHSYDYLEKMRKIREYVEWYGKNGEYNE